METKAIRSVLLEVFGGSADPSVDPFTYYVEILNTTNGGTGTGVLRIESDADFVLTHLCADVVYTGSKAPALGLASDGTDKLTAGGGPRSWPFKVQINESSTGRNLFAAPTPLHLVAGQGAALPYRLPRPRTIGKSSTLTIEVSRFGVGANDPDGGTSAAAAAIAGLDVQLGFMGLKVYDPQRSDLTGKRR